MENIYYQNKILDFIHCRLALIIYTITTPIYWIFLIKYGTFIPQFILGLNIILIIILCIFGFFSVFSTTRERLFDNDLMSNLFGHSFIVIYLFFIQKSYFLFAIIIGILSFDKGFGIIKSICVFLIFYFILRFIYFVLQFILIRLLRKKYIVQDNKVKTFEDYMTNVMPTFSDTTNEDKETKENHSVEDNKNQKLKNKITKYKETKKHSEEIEDDRWRA